MARVPSVFRDRLRVPVNVRRLLGNGAWAGLDQTLFAFSNFVLNVLLARWLSPPEYGAFTVAYAGFLLFGTAHSALLTEPMLVFGPGRHKERVKAYLGVLLQLHWRGTILAAAIVGIVAFGLRNLMGDGFGVVLVVLAAVSPLILFQWLMRRACYMRFEPRDAAMAGAMYLPIVIGAAFVLARTETLSPATALLVLGGASLLSGGWLWRRQAAGRGEPEGARLGEVAREHWSYGRWALAASLLSWVPTNVYYLLLPLWGGLEAAAALRAMTNLVLPILHLTTAVGAILLPTFVRAREEGTLRAIAWGSVGAFALAAAAYYVLVVAFRVPLVAWLFDGKYDAYTGLVWVLGVLPLTAAVTAVAGDVLRAQQRPERVFWAYVAATAAALTLGVAAVAAWSVQGAALGLVLSSTVTGVAMATFLRRPPKQAEA